MHNKQKKQATKFKQFDLWWHKQNSVRMWNIISDFFVFVINAMILLIWNVGNNKQPKKNQMCSNFFFEQKISTHSRSQQVRMFIAHIRFFFFFLFLRFFFLFFFWFSAMQGVILIFNSAFYKYTTKKINKKLWIKKQQRKKIRFEPYKKNSFLTVCSRTCICT